MDRMQRIFQQGIIVEKQNKLDELSVKIDRQIKDIYYYLYIVDGIEGIKIQHASQAMGELENAIREYKGIKAELKELSDG